MMQNMLGDHVICIISALPDSDMDRMRLVNPTIMQANDVCCNFSMDRSLFAIRLGTRLLKDQLQLSV